ncbi:hypothetical protein [Arthrobacter sp. OAP107]|uniref:hypothetical protein n=1 Tax=Arthrobacter sp. OAP107 TaxID=3156445 RepID=UPI003394A7B8
MTTEDQTAAHGATLELMGAGGGPLTAQSKTATAQNPERFNVRRGEPRQERRASCPMDRTCGRPFDLFRGIDM